MIPSKCIELKRIDRSQKRALLSHFFFALFCQTRLKLIDLFAIKLKHFFKIELSTVSNCPFSPKVYFPLKMKKKWILELGLFLISRVELCNFPIWYDKGIIDLVTLILIPTFCCIEGSKNGFLLPAFHVFLLVSMSPPLLSLQIINGQMLIFAHLLSKTRAGTPFDTDLERGAWSQKKNLQNGKPHQTIFQWKNPYQSWKII